MKVPNRSRERLEEAKLLAETEAIRFQTALSTRAIEWVKEYAIELTPERCAAAIGKEADVDELRQMVQLMAQHCMKMDVEVDCGAAYREKNLEPQNNLLAS